MFQLTTRTLRGKYRLSKNIFVTCYVNVLEATDKEIRTFIGLKQRGDNEVTVGTQIFFDAGPLNLVHFETDRTVELYSITVLKVEENEGGMLHICTPIDKEVRPDLRARNRMVAEFPVRLADKDTEFVVKDGTSKGLALIYKEKRAMASLIVNKSYDFTVTYKDHDYTIPADIKHIQYDWRSHRHMVGIHFPKVTQDQEIILNLLLDPDYTIPITDNQTVDTALGKISLKDF